jgi:hypothetical protein
MVKKQEVLETIDKIKRHPHTIFGVFDHKDILWFAHDVLSLIEKYEAVLDYTIEDMKQEENIIEVIDRLQNRREII